MTPYNYWAEVQIKLPIHLLVDQARTFVIRISNHDCLLKFQESPQPFFQGPGFEEMTNMELKYDRHGLIRALDAKIRLPGPLLDIQPEQISAEGIESSDHGSNVLDNALAVINEFIDAYRFLSGEFHVRRLSQSDLVGVWTVQVDWFKDSRYVVSSAVGQFGPGMTLARNPAPEEFQTELQEMLHRPQIPLHGLLLLNAKAFMEFGEYRMAVIDSRASLEVLVDGVLNQAFICKSVAQVREILKVTRGTGLPSIQAVIGSARINDKLKHGLRNAVGESPADHTRLWRRWLNVKRIREQAVHYGQAVDKRQSEDHIAVVEDIGALLSVEGVSANWKVTYVESGSFTTQWFGS